MRRYTLAVPKAVWSVLAPLAPSERDRVLAAALAPRAFAGERVLVRDRDGYPLAPCAPARARRLVRAARAEWVRYCPPVIRLLVRREEPRR